MSVWITAARSRRGAHACSLVGRPAHTDYTVRCQLFFAVWVCLDFGVRCAIRFDTLDSMFLGSVQLCGLFHVFTAMLVMSIYKYCQHVR